MCLVLGRSFGSRASSKAPELSSNTLQEMLGRVKMTWNPFSFISCIRFMTGMTSRRACDIAIVQLVIENWRPNRLDIPRRTLPNRCVTWMYWYWGPNMLTACSSCLRNQHHCWGYYSITANNRQTSRSKQDWQALCATSSEERKRVEREK